MERFDDLFGNDKSDQVNKIKSFYKAEILNVDNDAINLNCEKLANKTWHLQIGVWTLAFTGIILFIGTFISGITFLLELHSEASNYFPKPLIALVLDIGLLEFIVNLGHLSAGKRDLLTILTKENDTNYLNRIISITSDCENSKLWRDYAVENKGVLRGIDFEIMELLFELQTSKKKSEEQMVIYNQAYGIAS